MQDRPRLVGVVDDDQAVRDSLRFLLEAAGFPVAVFASAAQFMAAADFSTLGCVVLDHHMPQVTGLMLLRHLRQTGRVIPAALMTGSPSPQLTQQALAAGATVVLEKPLAEAALFSFVQAAIPPEA